MPKRKTNSKYLRRGQHAVVDPAGVQIARGVTCVGSDRCTGELVPGSPVALCGKHLREVYEFAQDVISQRWDGAMRDYVTNLHRRFRPPRAVTKEQPGNLYFIRFGQRIKVGYSENPAARLRELPHEEVLGIVTGTRADEQAWHRLLADYHVTGEWFEAEPEVLEAIARVLAAGG